MTNYHEDIALALRSPGMSAYTLNRDDASDLLDEWEDARAMIRALEALVAQLQGAAPEPPAWTVIA